MNDISLPDPRICRMADRCATRDRITGQPARDEGRGFCWPDELHGEHAIAELPADWLAVVQRTGKDAARQGLGGIPTARAEAPIPLHLHLDALARRIAWTLDVWATVVRERARLAEDEWRKRVRPGYAVHRDAGILVRFYSALLALGPWDYLDYETQIPAVDDGPGAVAQLVALHHQARSMLGLTRRRERRDLPCPPPPDGTPEAERRAWGCGLHELGEWIGSGDRYYDTTAGQWATGPNIVACGHCGWSCTADEYALYAVTFIPPGVRR